MQTFAGSARGSGAVGKIRDTFMFQENWEDPWKIPASFRRCPVVPSHPQNSGASEACPDEGDELRGIEEQQGCLRLAKGSDQQAGAEQPAGKR